MGAGAAPGAGAPPGPARDKSWAVTDPNSPDPPPTDASERPFSAASLLANGLAYTLSPVPGAGMVELGTLGAEGVGGGGGGGGGADAEGAGAAAFGGGAAVLSSLKSLKAATSDSLSTMMQTS